MVNKTDKNEMPIGRVKAQMSRRKFAKHLGMVALQDIVALIWHIDRIQSNRGDGNKFFKNFPNEAQTTDFRSPYFIFKWYLETLLSEFFVARPRSIKPGGKIRFLRTDDWNTVALLVNLNREIEEAESLHRLKHGDLFLELHRIAQRQIPWQKGLVGKRILYRYLSIYRSPETCQRFAEIHGITFDDFVLAGYLFWTISQQSPQIDAKSNFSNLGINNHARDKALKLLSDTPKTAAAFYLRCRKKPKVAHLPSRLRTNPIMVFREKRSVTFAAPLTDLVLQRVTSELSYDFFAFNDLKEGIASRFVKYARDHILAGKNSFNTYDEITYKRQNNKVKSPDLFLFQNGYLSAVIECKARRLSHTAQFATDPINDAEQAFDELAKGIVQLWRYCSDATSGLIPDHGSPSKTVAFMLLTLGPWLDASETIQRHILKYAADIADAKGIDKEHRRNVSFVSMEDLEYLVDKGESNEIIATLHAQNTEQYAYWSVQAIFDCLFKHAKRTDSVSIEMLHQVAPWFKKISSQKSGK